MQKEVFIVSDNFRRWERTLAIIFVLGALFGVTAFSSGDWPTIGHNLLNTSWNEQEVSLKPPLELAWTTILPNKHRHIDYLVVYGDTLLTAEGAWGEDGDEPNRVEAFDTRTGSKLWSFLLSTDSGGSMGNCPAVDNNIAYFGGQGDDFLYAVDIRTGDLQWRFEGVKSSYEAHPKVYQDRVYIQGRGNFYSIDKQTGILHWQISNESRGRTTAAIVDNTLFIGFSDGRLLALDPITGRIKWERFESSGAFNIVTVCEAKGILVSCSMVSKDPSQGRVVAYALDGQFKWDYQDDLGLWVPYATANGILYLSGSNRSLGRAELVAIDIESGNALWRFHVPSQSISSPCVANNVVYFTEYYRGTLYALDAQTGEEVWSYNLRGGCCQPIVANGALYVSAGNTLYKFQEKADNSPTADFSFTPSDPCILDEVHFTDRSTDPDGDIVSWEWNFDDGTTSPKPNPIHRYEREGTFTVTLTVTDNDGLTDETSQTIAIEHKDLIQANFTFHAVDEVLHKIHLDATASIDTMGEIVRYEWDWDGDGVYDTAVQVPEMMHRFDGEGPYQVILTVADDQGNRASCTKEVRL